jgi:hypothetical protein
LASTARLQEQQSDYTKQAQIDAHLSEKWLKPTKACFLNGPKSAAQIQDETVQTSAELAAERTKWISKVLRQIGKFKPGTRRKDLLNAFATESGLSTQTQRTYVYIECPYIKVTIHFKASSNESTEIQDDPDDIIESISQPYLQGGVYD